MQLLLNIKLLLLTHLYILHSGTLVMKMKSLLILGIMFSPIVYITEKLSGWVIENEDYVMFVSIAILIDYIIGTIYHIWWVKDGNFKDNAIGFLIKFTMVISVGYLFEGLSYFLHSIPYIVGISIGFLRLVVFMYPTWSAIGNIYEITGHKFPPKAFMNKLDNLTNVKKS